MGDASLTKAARLAAARAVIDRNMIDVPFSSEDVAEMNSILGTSMSGFVRKFNKEWPTDPRHLYALTGDGWQMLSWVKRINQPSWEQQAKRAMRAVTRELLTEFKESQPRPHVCEECKEVCKGKGRDASTADETPPHDDMVNEYVAIYGWPKFSNPPHIQGWVFDDIDDEARWIEFHQSRVTYRLLCLSCNASKGKCKAPKTSKAARSVKATQPSRSS